MSITGKLIKFIPLGSKKRLVNCTLSNEDIQAVVDEIESVLENLRYERTNAIRLRLSAEESLLRWRDRFGADHPVTIIYELRMNRVLLVFRLNGESCNPVDMGDEFDSWPEDLMSNIGLVPSYSYKNGNNTLTYFLGRQSINPAVKLLIFIFLGILIGGVMSGFFPGITDEASVAELLDSVQGSLSRLINAIGGPVFFLTVTATTINAGKIRRSGGIGKTLMKRFILINFLVGIIGMAVSIPLFHTAYTLEMLTFSQASNLIDFFLQIIPSDIVSPFMTYNCAQLVLMGIVLGSAINYMGREVSAVSNLLNQLNRLGLVMAEWISRLIPVFVTIIVAIVIRAESELLRPGVLMPLIPFSLLTALVLSAELIIVSRRYNVSVKGLCKKMRPSFVIAFRTANVNESFGANLACCTNRFGVNSRLAEQSLPIGLVLLMPFASLSTIIFTLYVAARFDAGGSVDWYLMLLFLSVTLSTAIPPMAGSGIITYSVIFAQLGIPMGSLVLAMIMDTLFSFGVAAADQAALQLEMIRVADATNMLDLTRLNKE